MIPIRQLFAALAIAPALASFVIAFASAQDQKPQEPPESQEPPRKIVRVTAERFAFSPSEIVVEEGTLLEIQLTSDDTNHGFRIKGTSTNVVIPKRGRGALSVKFDALTPGRYAFECSKMCGAGHAMMKGAIVVKPRQAAPAAPQAPASGQAASSIQRER
jgi:cytochrome c oxidase subunit 2